MKLKYMALALMLALPLGACADVASFVTSTATNLSSSTPSQVTTLNEAALATDLVVKATKAAVDTNKLDLATLTKLQALRAAVRAAMNDIVAANTAGNSLDFAAFNGALDAYRAYATQKGITS